MSSPRNLADRQSWLVKMAAARKQLEEDAAAKARKEAEQKARDRGDDDGTAAGKGEEAATKAVVRPTAQRNFTDPDARIMKTSDGSYHYCYNAQAVVDADHQVIVATELNNTAVDVRQFIPLTGRTAETWAGCPPSGPSTQATAQRKTSNTSGRSRSPAAGE